MSIKELLSYPLFYDALQALVGSSRARRLLVDEYIKPFPQAKILDIGCGTGNMRRYLPDYVQYTGIDINQMYINAAKKEFTINDTFICCDITDLGTTKINRTLYDIILAIGLIHHLNDEKAKRVFIESRKLLSSGGRIVTFDNVYTSQQSCIARHIISHDRGKFVRNLDEYMNLICSSFQQVETIIRNDLMLIPYTHCILIAKKEVNP